MTQPKADSPTAGNGSNSLVYVVDDEPMVLELALVVLGRLDHHIETFRDAEAALELFQRAKPRPSLVISDYAMHRMNGLGLLEACRRIVPEQRFLLVSGTVDASVYVDSPWKPDRFLAKPYSPEQLIKVVNALLNR